MSIAEPLPVSGYGTAAWTDYDHNWRDDDAKWLQERAILRFATTADRNTALPAAPVGQVIYNDQTKVLEMKYTAGWFGYNPIWRNITPSALDGSNDSATQVVVSHAASGGKGVVYRPSAGLGEVEVNAARFLTAGGVLTADATGVSLKVGATTAKLITDATHLISDSPVSAPGFVISGAGTLDATGKAVTVGALTAASASIPAITGVTSLALTGTLTGGVINGASGTIGGVGLGTPIASNGFAAGWVASGGYFSGNTSGALMRWRNTADGALGACVITVQDAGIYFDAGTTYLRNTVRFENAAAPVRHWIWTTPGADAYLGPVIYQTTDPGAANYPNGTLWIS